MRCAPSRRRISCARCRSRRPRASSACAPTPTSWSASRRRRSSTRSASSTASSRRSRTTRWSGCSVKPDISLLEGPSPASLPLEIVERKGLGHPDTICDALTENLSRALSHYYLERCGAILHHNVDKALLCGGVARPAFGGGEIVVTIPVEELAVEESRRWLRANLRHLDPVRHVHIHPRIRPTSPDLAALFLRRRAAGAPLANDTSLAVGYAPLDELESAVLAVERRLNAPEVKAAHPEIGEDIKVMGTRSGRELSLT